VLALRLAQEVAQCGGEFFWHVEERPVMAWERNHLRIEALGKDLRHLGVPGFSFQTILADADKGS
jgi:hypothetical protein